MTANELNEEQPLAMVELAELVDKFATKLGLLKARGSARHTNPVVRTWVWLECLESKGLAKGIKEVLIDPLFWEFKSYPPNVMYIVHSPHHGTYFDAYITIVHQITYQPEQCVYSATLPFYLPNVE